jgi:hypothetical protein
MIIAVNAVYDDDGHLGKDLRVLLNPLVVINPERVFLVNVF